MTGWDIDAPGVQDVMKAVQKHSEGADDAVSEDKFESIHEDLTIGGPGGVARNGVTGGVEEAVNMVFDEQSATIKDIFVRMDASVAGVAAATVEYLHGDGDMAGAATAQAEMLKAAETGDLTYFENFDYDRTDDAP